MSAEEPSHSRSDAPPSVLDAVFDDSRRSAGATPPWSQRLAPWFAALAVHVGLYAFAAQTEASLETWSARMAAIVHEELAKTAPVAIEEPPLPPPPKAESPEPIAQIPDEAPPRPVRAPAAPAQAGEVVTANPDPSGPVDLTSNTFVTGTANAYAGGATTRRGTSPVAAPPVVDPKAVGPGVASRARPVQLPEAEWRCPWPNAALAEEIYEQFVVLRVVVRSDGSAESATAVRDPGHGFGDAAVACARQTRFKPARNATGQPIRATSPLIRVRFTR